MNEWLSAVDEGASLENLEKQPAVTTTSNGDGRTAAPVQDVGENGDGGSERELDEGD